MPHRTEYLLIVEDVRSLAETYAAYLADDAYRIVIANSGEEALAQLTQRLPSVIILDVNLPDMTGLDILQKVKSAGLPTEVIVITSKGSVNLAVEAMKEGAFDFIMKPLSAERLRVTVRNARDRRKMANQIAEITDEFGREKFVDFIGHSLAMQSVYRIVQSAAPTNATVFITGESGTGKELCASALHKLSKRQAGPFVVINCAAIPKDLLESEIFGHVKGAFTGATSDRKGAALQAHGGTLFLDEIGEMDLSLQSKMLRFLQDKSVRRVGEDVARPVDVRIVCATNRDPMAEVAAGRFREDLFYRLHVVPIELPPLRERDDDVLLIARHLLADYCKQDGKSFKGFTAKAEAVLVNSRWPGNVRELQNAIRRIVIFHDAEWVDETMLPGEIVPRANPQPAPLPLLAGELLTAVRSEPKADAPIRSLDDVIRDTIELAIARCDGSVPRAAAALQVSPSTLYRRIQGWQTES